MAQGRPPIELVVVLAVGLVIVLVLLGVCFCALSRRGARHQISGQAYLKDLNSDSPAHVHNSAPPGAGRDAAGHKAVPKTKLLVVEEKMSSYI